MTVRVGKHQIETLIVLASPTCALLVSGRSEAGMVRRGLLREREPGKAVCITPLGLRVLADEMESGRVDDALDRMRKDVEARQARMPAKREAKAP
jgi:hypothetical protein